MRKAKRLLPPGTEWIDYRFDAAYGQEHAAKARQAAAAFGPAILRFGLEGSENNLLPSRYDTLVVGEAMRAAAMSRYSALHAGVVTGALSGKSPEGTKAIGQSHAFYLPQDTKNAGTIDAIDVWLPAGCTHEEFRALSAITRLYYRLSSSEHPEFALTFLGATEPTIARVWESTTPLVLDRFPKADAAPADQVRMALERRGLEPESIDVWAPRRHVELRGGRHLRLDAFRKNRLRKSGVLPPMIGATLRFQTPVAGPVVLGRLAHFGLGQFRPSEL
jgi:CRISPR-associated protein Csb2